MLGLGLHDQTLVTGERVLGQGLHGPQTVVLGDRVLGSGLLGLRPGVGEVAGAERGRRGEVGGGADLVHLESSEASVSKWSMK